MGTGVLGPVYRARESDGDRTVAIKSFHLDLTPEQVEIFGNALAHIVKVEVSHPAIVAPLAAGLESGTPFMAYEYVAAESLDVALRRAAQPAEGLAWIAALAGAVDAAHALGLVHGALHLRDVLVTQEGVCATGFGIASALEHVRLGFPIRRPYTAPEVLAGHRWGPPADRFAVAALAYELLTGTRLSGSGDGAIADLRALRPDVADPAGLQQAFRNALAEDPDIRSASATGFVTALARALGADAVDSAPAAALGGAPADADGFAAGFLDESPPEQSGAPPERLPTPPVRIALPDPVAALGDEDAGAGTPDDEDGVPGDDGSDRKRRAARSPRRPANRTDAPRRSRPVVAVREDVQWDPPGGRRAVESSASKTSYDDDDVPPPPSPTSMRALAPVVFAMAVGVLVAYLVSTGLGTPGDEAAGGAADQSAVADTGVEWSEETVGGVETPPTPSAGQPRRLAREPLVPVGDPPLAGGDSLAPAPQPVDPDPPVASPPPEAVAPVASPPPEAAAPIETAESAAPAGATEPTAADAGTEVGAGSLYVDSRPRGAAVSVDDVVVGVTPVDLAEVATGARVVRIEMPGYRPWVTEVDVSGTERVRVGASLEPESR